MADITGSATRLQARRSPGSRAIQAPIQAERAIPQAVGSTGGVKKRPEIEAIEAGARFCHRGNVPPASGRTRELISQVGTVLRRLQAIAYSRAPEAGPPGPQAAFQARWDRILSALPGEEFP